MDDPFAPDSQVVPTVYPASSSRPALRRFSRWLYTQNPFYLLSAWLVFFGLRWSFGPGTALESSAALFTGLLTYTLLLALAALAVVRVARVWDDARSMLLLVVLMFVGTSVALDETLAAQPETGRYYYLAAWIGAALTSEALLRGIRLQLVGYYRLAYHALLALFFGYPVALSPWFQSSHDPRLLWLLFGFTPAASACFALLWPALRRGASYVRENGSPWPWPLFPWSLFVILAVCLAGRAYYLCLSFHFIGAGSTIFGPYFLLPLVACLAGLWIYGASRSPWPGIAQVLLLAPPCWVLMSSWHPSSQAYHEFLSLYVETLGASPLYVAMLVAIVYYGYARWLAVPGAEWGVTLSLVAISFLAPQSHIFRFDGAPAVWPWCLAAAWHGVLCWRERSTWRGLLTAALASFAVSASLAEFPAVWRWSAAYHFFLIAVLLLSCLDWDALGRWLARLAAPLLFLGCLAILARADRLFPDQVLAFQLAYGAGMAIIALALAGLLRRYVYALVSACLACGTLLIGVWPWYGRTREGSPGLDYLLLGAMCLLLGLAISFAKGGYFNEARRWLREQFATATIDS